MFFKHLGLFLLSIILKPIISFIGFIYGIIKNPKNVSNKLLELSISNDRYMGGASSELLNDYLFTKDSEHKLGDTRETISSYIGRNRLENTLTKEGEKWDSILNKIDNNHSIDAIGWKSKK